MLALSLCSALLAALVPARAADSVTWLMSDFPPVGEPANGKPGNGIADQVVKYLVEHWPHATHRFLYANPNRVWSMIAAGEHVCFAHALRTPEREKIAYFRNAYLLPPPQLIVRPQAMPDVAVNASGEADLGRVLHNPRLRGLIVETRSYGPAIDALLADKAASPHIKRLAPGNYGRNILTMLLLDRADYTIELDFVMAHVVGQNAELGKLKTVPLADGPGLLIGGIACPRNAWGREAMRQIDHLLASPQGAAVLTHAQGRWMNKESSQRHGAAMKEFLRRVTTPQPQEYQR